MGALPVLQGWTCVQISGDHRTLIENWNSRALPRPFWQKHYAIPQITLVNPHQFTTAVILFAVITNICENVQAYINTFNIHAWRRNLSCVNLHGTLSKTTLLMHAKLRRWISMVQYTVIACRCTGFFSLMAGSYKWTNCVLVRKGVSVSLKLLITTWVAIKERLSS